MPVFPIKGMTFAISMIKSPTKGCVCEGQNPQSNLPNPVGDGRNRCQGSTKGNWTSWDMGTA